MEWRRDDAPFRLIKQKVKDAEPRDLPQPFVRLNMTGINSHGPERNGHILHKLTSRLEKITQN